MRIAVCDDQPEVLGTLKDMLEAIDLPEECTVAAFTDAEEFLRHLGNAPADIAIVDIVLDGGPSGIELAKRINKDCPDTAVIFISGCTDYAEKLYETEHLYFLQKPLSPDKLTAAINKASARKRGDVLTVARKGYMVNVRQSDIVMVENSGRSVFIHMSDGESICHTAKMADVEKLLSPAVFLRCHHSYIVNMDYIVRVDPNSIILAGSGTETTAPISRRYAATVKTTLLKKMGDLL